MITNVQPSLSSRDRWLKRIPFLLILTFLVYRFIALYDFKTPKHVEVSALDLKTLGGTSIPQSQLQGKAILLNYWAPWCAPCLAEIPRLRQLQADHPNDLVIVGVVSDPADYLQAVLYMKDSGVSYPLAQETPGMDKVFGAVTGIPVTIYISHSGNVVHRVDGVISEKLMKRYVADTLR